MTWHMSERGHFVNSLHQQQTVWILSSLLACFRRDLHQVYWTTSNTIKYSRWFVSKYSVMKIQWKLGVVSVEYKTHNRCLLCRKCTMLKVIREFIQTPNSSCHGLYSELSLAFQCLRLCVQNLDKCRLCRPLGNNGGFFIY